MKPLIPAVIMTCIASYFAYFTISRVDHDVIFDGEIQFVIGTLTLIIFCVVLYKGVQAYRAHRQWTALLPAILGLVIGIGLILTLYLLELRDRSPVRLSCVTKMVDFNGAAFDFREDGTYKFISWSLGADYYRGCYTCQDSIITLDKYTIEKVIESNRLVIRQDGEREPDGSIGKSIYQIDSTGRVIPGSIDFRVHKNVIR